ncbi:Uncharacterized protein HZ326_4902 [Fusarium oxysporum f. sp. albedinis]|nr:Uncharacterized protein HZ326_4902 [Fusarium oxysporum f. sp. albedinis]
MSDHLCIQWQEGELELSLPCESKAPSFAFPECIPALTNSGVTQNGFPTFEPQKHKTDCALHKQTAIGIMFVYKVKVKVRLFFARACSAAIVSSVYNVNINVIVSGCRSVDHVNNTDSLIRARIVPLPHRDSVALNKPSHSNLFIPAIEQEVYAASTALHVENVTSVTPNPRFNNTWTTERLFSLARPCHCSVLCCAVLRCALPRSGPSPAQTVKSRSHTQRDRRPRTHQQSITPCITSSHPLIINERHARIISSLPCRLLPNIDITCYESHTRPHEDNQPGPLKRRAKAKKVTSNQKSFVFQPPQTSTRKQESESTTRVSPRPKVVSAGHSPLGAGKKNPPSGTVSSLTPTQRFPTIFCSAQTQTRKIVARGERQAKRVCSGLGLRRPALL